MLGILWKDAERWKLPLLQNFDNHPEKAGGKWANMVTVKNSGLTRRYKATQKSILYAKHCILVSSFLLEL